MRARCFLPLLAVITLPGTPLCAQQPEPLRIAAFDRLHVDAARAAPVWPGRLLSALGGAALGAGMGFFASQVVRGDWEDGSGGVDRPVWAAVGGSIGFAVGFSLPVAGRGVRPDRTRSLPGGRAVIRATEFQGTGVKTAGEAVALLRPEWLRERGTHVLGETADETIQVYLDDVRLGGVRFLHDVSAAVVRSIHFFDAAAATLRWGAGHSHGVILIVAEGGLPPRGGS